MPISPNKNPSTIAHIKIGWFRSGVREARELIGISLANVVRMDFAWDIYQSAAQSADVNPLV